MTAVVIPACGRIGCNLEREYPKHKHDDFAAGDRVVATPKRSQAPGWVFACPVGTVVSANASNATIVLDDGNHREIALDLLTRWHSWRKRKIRAANRRRMPRLSRLHRIDPAFPVDEPPLFGEIP